jgi:hypothetical protein
MMNFFALERPFRLLPLLPIAMYSLTGLAQEYPGDTPVPASPAPMTTNSVDENHGKSACAVTYPPFARQHEVQGDLVVEYTLDEEGNHKNIRVISRKLNKTSVRNRGGHLVDVTTVFDDAVIRALSVCRQPVSKYTCPLFTTRRRPSSFQLSG